MRRVLKILLVSLVGLVALAVVAVLVITQTTFGHERVRRFALGALEGAVHGKVRMGKIGGDLLRGIVINDVSITDSAGAPFLSADTVRVGYSLRTLLSKKLHLSNVRLVELVIVLDKPARGADWNYQRIFRSDATASTDTLPGWGAWIALNDLTLVNGRVVVRTPWDPRAELTGAARDSAIAAALGGETRTRVDRGTAGLQRVMDFRALTGRLPRVRIADPDSAAMLFEVATLRGIAEPFRPPAAEIRDLAGTFRVDGDSLWFRGVRAALPGSRIAGDGTYVLDSLASHDAGDMVLRLRGHPVALTDLRWILPRLPAYGGGSLDFAMIVRGETRDFLARGANVRVQEATFAGDFGLLLADSVRFHDTDLRFAGVDTRLIEQLAPAIDVPRRGTLGGRLALAGTLSALQVGGSATFDDVLDGRSRLVVNGVVGIGNGFRAQNLWVRLDPLQVALARIAVPTLPIGGLLSGEVHLDGSTASRMRARMDVVHQESGERSRLTGRGEVALAGSRWMDVSLRAMPISLATVGRFVPALGLQGAMTGDIIARGSFRDLGLHLDLFGPRGGRLTADGQVDIASRDVGYDLTTGFEIFDLSAVVARAPRTSLSGVATVRGRGFDPQTMRAAFGANVMRATLLDSVTVDTAHVRIAIADGLARVDSFVVHTPFASLDAEGTLGLVAGREGELSYRAEIDSLSGFARWIPRDSGVVGPRPARVAHELRRARADSARLAAATEVERAIRGTPGPVLDVDTIPKISRDSLGGSVYAGGVVRGSIARFDVRGRAGVNDLLMRGNVVRRGQLEYAWTNARTPEALIVVGASLNSVQAAGFALDSVDARVSYRKPGGTLELAIRQDDERRYGVRARYALHLDHSEVHFDELRMRFDTTTWVAAVPGTIDWGARGIEIKSLDLRSGRDGRIYVNGRLPTEAAGSPADLEVAIHGLQIAHLTALMQGEPGVSGIISMNARATGTLRDPRFRGAAAVTDGAYAGTSIPDIRSTFDYGDALLVAHAELTRGGSAIAVADARLPVNLALSGYTGPRMLQRPLEVDLVADSLPLDVLPKFTDAVADIRGRLIGVVSVRGTADRPHAVGQVALDLGSLRVVSSGTHLRDIAGALRMMGDTIVIDSLVGQAGGPIKLRGGLDISKLSQPGFDLRVTAVNALVLDNEQGRVRADANIEIAGPFEAIYVTGNANVRNGVIYVPKSDHKQVLSPGDPAVFSVVDTSVVDERELLPGESPLLKNLRMDVALHISRDTWVRSPEANVEIFTDQQLGDLAVNVDRGNNAVMLEGVVNTDRGEYTVAGRRFLISRGAVTFIRDPGLDPLLQLIGTRTVQLPGNPEFEIQVVVGGTLRNPRVTLQSNAQPPISQSDILSYLAFGRSSSSLLQNQGSASVSGRGAATGQLVGDVAAIAARQLAAVAIGALTQELETGAARQLGADVFNVAPADVPTELSLTGVGGLLRGTEVEIGKYLNRSRTFVSVQARPRFDVFPGVRLEHRLGGGFSLESSYEPRYLLRPPTFARIVDLQPVQVFGVFFSREWRFGGRQDAPPHVHRTVRPE